MQWSHCAMCAVVCEVMATNLLYCPPQNAPGPGEYNLSKRPISAPNPNGAPFGVSVERADKRSQRFFLGNTVSTYVCTVVPLL